MDILGGMLQRDKDDFSRVCNRLLSSCFLCKRNETNKSDYYFVMKYKEKFSDCFALLGTVWKSIRNMGHSIDKSAEL